MVKSVDTTDLKSVARKGVPVRFRFEAPHPSTPSNERAKKNPKVQCHNATFGGGTGGILSSVFEILPMTAQINLYESTIYSNTGKPHSVPSHSWEDLKSLVPFSLQTPNICSLQVIISKPVIGNLNRDPVVCLPEYPNRVYFVKRDSAYAGGLLTKNCGTDVALTLPTVNFDSETLPLKGVDFIEEILYRHLR